METKDSFTVFKKSENSSALATALNPPRNNSSTRYFQQSRKQLPNFNQSLQMSEALNQSKPVYTKQAEK